MGQLGEGQKIRRIAKPIPAPTMVPMPVVTPVPVKEPVAVPVPR